MNGAKLFYSAPLSFTFGKNKMKTPAIIVLLASILSGCNKSTLKSKHERDHDYELTGKDFGADTLLYVEQEMELIMPKGAKGLNFFYKAPFDPAFRAKIEILPSTKNEIIKKLSSFPTKPVNVSGDWSTRFSWWTPTSENVIQDREHLDGSIYRRAILTEKNDRLFLYLDWTVT